MEETESVSFFQWLENLIQPVRDFIERNYTNPLFWIGLVVLGLAIFGFTYNALHKNR